MGEGTLSTPALSEGALQEGHCSPRVLQVDRNRLILGFEQYRLEPPLSMSRNVPSSV